ncbi:hypothetical protein AMJ49_05250 [Parcubacteria bacterium DG_74_2]|nr:MAG: hypothetical protein AMJ49_05250 [Parcubacteria bacterium DG_74_2]
MAITFVEKQKKQKYLFFILLGLLLLTFFFLQREFLTKPEPMRPLIEAEIPEAKKIKINFAVLESPRIQGLEAFEEPVSLEPGEQVGRENPFLPY